MNIQLLSDTNHITKYCMLER